MPRPFPLSMRAWVRAAAAVALVAAGLTPRAADAADMYRWVDETGRTHVADTVPERFRQKATRLDSKAYDATPAQRAEALARAASYRAALQPPKAASAAASASPPAAAAPSAGPARAGPQAQAPPANTAPSPAAHDCAALFQRYFEGQACFAPCRLAGGGIRVECFQRCADVPDPSPRCGTPNLVSPRPIAVSP